MNLYGGSGGRVSWHSDDEGLFGKRGESKLIVSMSFRASALFKWKPGPGPDSDASSSWLHHGDLLVMNGRCQDEYLHCTDPLQGGERVNITFRWIRNHVPRCPVTAGVVCFLPTCVKGSSVPTNAGSSLPGFLLLVSLLVLVGWGLFRVVALVSTNLGLQCRSLCCTRLVGRDRCGFGRCGSVQKSGGRDPGRIVGRSLPLRDFWVLDALVWIRLPSLPQNRDTHSVLWLRRAHRGNKGQKHSETSCSRLRGFLVSRISLRRFWGKILWYLWNGRARHFGPCSNNLDVEVFNVGGFLTHGDFALETDADFLAVVEHRLVPARARSETKRLERAGLWSIGLERSSPLFAHYGYCCFFFSEFYALGRVVRCHLPVAKGRVVHLVVIYGFQGASTDPEKLRLTEKLLYSFLCELAVVGSGQHCLSAGNVNVEPARVLGLQQGIMAGQRLDLQTSWAAAAGLDRALTCKQVFGATNVSGRDFFLGCPLASAALGWCRDLEDCWVLPHHSVRASFRMGRWTARFCQPIRYSVIWPAAWVSAKDKTRSSKSAEVRRIWEVYDECLQVVHPGFLEEIRTALLAGDVSLA